MKIRNTWPINVKVIIPRKNGEEWYFDKARRYKDQKGKIKFKLKNMKDDVNPVAFGHMVQTNKGLFVELYSPAKGEYYPCETDSDGKTTTMKYTDSKTGEVVEKTTTVYAVRPMPVDQKHFYADGVDYLHTRWQNKKGLLEKYMPVILFILFIFGFVMMTYAMANYGIPGIQDAADKAVGVWKEVTKQGDTVLQAINAQKAAVPPPPG